MEEESSYNLRPHVGKVFNSLGRWDLQWTECLCRQNSNVEILIPKVMALPVDGKEAMRAETEEQNPCAFMPEGFQHVPCPKGSVQ